MANDEQERGENVDNFLVFEAGISIQECQPKKINGLMLELIRRLSDKAESPFLGNCLDNDKVDNCLWLSRS
ncbi:MAG: hypothetical protein CL860_05775 [Cyanobium sp. MED195]|nr:hypothetical protein [Cyanobium sp. MED195]